MSHPLAWGACAGSLVLALFCGWRGSRPPDPHRGPRMIPWRFLMTFFALGFLLSGAFLVQVLALD